MQNKRKKSFLIFCIGSFIFLMAMGVWQTYRLQWKSELIARIKKNIEQDVIDINKLECLFNGENNCAEENEFRKVRLKGRFLGNYEFYLAGKYNDGRLGYEIIAPFLVAGDEGEKEVFINKGWIPAEEKNDEKRRSLSMEITEIEGVVRKVRMPWSFILPENSRKDNLWFWLDLKEMKRSIPELETAYDKNNGFYIDLSEEPPQLRNDHLQYLITWYSLALAVVIMGYIYLKKDRASEEKP